MKNIPLKLGSRRYPPLFTSTNQRLGSAFDDLDPRFSLSLSLSITRVRSTKSLGVVFDQRLVWEEHVDSLCKRVSSGLAALKQARQYVPQDTLLMIYNAVIKPLFDYCDVVWGNLNKTLMARLQKLQNRAARIITRKGYDVRSADIRKELRWDDLETIRKKTFSSRYVQSCKQQSSKLSHQSF